MFKKQTNLKRTYQQYLIELINHFGTTDNEDANIQVIGDEGNGCGDNIEKVNKILHFPIKKETRKLCLQCNTKRVFTSCGCCDVYLCCYPCFEHFHNNNE